MRWKHSDRQDHDHMHLTVTRRPRAITLSATLVLALVVSLAAWVPASADGWTSSTDLGPGSEPTPYFDVAINKSGEAAAAWVSGTSVRFASRAPGQPWSGWEEIGSGATTPQPEAPVVLLTDDGLVHVIWAAPGTGEPNQAFDLQSRTRTPGGAWGPIQTYAPGNGYGIFGYGASLTADSGAIVRWSTFGYGFATRLTPAGHWETHHQYPLPSDVGLAADTVRDGAGATVLWSNITTGFVLTQTWRDGGWGPMTTAFEGSMVMDTAAEHPSGWLATSYPGDTETLVQRRTPAGEWLLPVTIPSSGRPSDASIAIDGQGRVVVAWLADISNEQRTAFATVIDPATGPAPTVALTSTGDHAKPIAVFASDGSAAVAWGEGLGNSTRAVKSRSWSQAQGWGEPITLGSANTAWSLRATSTGDGDAILAWINSAGRLQTRTLDRTPPKITTLAWSGSFVNEPIQFSATATDTWSPVSGATWDLGGGAGQQGLTTSHAFTEAGLHPVSLTVTDAAGNSSTQQVLVTVGTRDAPVTVPHQPTMSRFALDRRKIRLKGPKAKRRTTAWIDLDGSGRVQIQWSKKVVKVRKGKKRTVLKPVGTSAYDMKPGANRLTLRPKVGSKRLKVGRYVLVATIGQSSRTAKLRVTR